MTAPGTPRLVRGGLVLLDPLTDTVLRVVPLQYNPDSVTRTFQVRGAGAEAGARAEALRLTGPPAQTVTLDAELDATDAMERGDPLVGEVGLHAQLAVLEGLVSPPSAAVLRAAELLATGGIEIAPTPAPLTLFVWSRQRIMPVRVTELSIVEEAFDPALNPIRAKVHLGLRVSTVNDVGVTSRAGGYAVAQHQRLERLAARQPGGTLGQLGIERLR